VLLMNLLFMCVANSARSQLAEGLARELFGEKVSVQSAGSNPGTLNPFAVRVMKEIGLDISKHFSKRVDDLAPEFLLNLDYVITLCAEEVCPVLPSSAKKLHWPMKDPAGQGSDSQQLERFRETRDRLRERLLVFQKEHAA
jgi:arsenate reductase